MGNMSYCRFENTIADLGDCIGAVGEMIEGGYDLSEREQRAFKRMLAQAAELLEMVGDAIGMEAAELSVCKIFLDGDSIVESFRESCGDVDQAE